MDLLSRFVVLDSIVSLLSFRNEALLILFRRLQYTFEVGDQPWHELDQAGKASQGFLGHTAAHRQFAAQDTCQDSSIDVVWATAMHYPSGIEV